MSSLVSLSVRTANFHAARWRVMKKSAAAMTGNGMKFSNPKIIDKKKIIDTKINTSYDEKLLTRNECKSYIDESLGKLDKTLSTMREECQSYIDESLGKLNKKVKDLSDLVIGAFDILKDFDNMKKNVQSWHQLTTDSFVEMGKIVKGVSQDLDKLREHHEENVVKVREDLTELENFVDNAADKLNLPKMRGKRKIKIKR